MKKIALLAGFFCLLTSGVFAQSNWDGTGFRFGIQASPSAAWMNSSDKLLEGAGTNLGLKLGIMGENYFSPNYALISGIGFNFNTGGTIQNGYSQANPWPKSELSVTIGETDSLSLPQNAKLHYRVTQVEIPIGLRMKGGSGTDNPLSFFAEAPVFTLGFTTRALGDIKGSTKAYQNTVDEDIRKDVNGISLSWGIGAGIEYEVAANATLTAGLFYQNQFTDLSSDKGRVFNSQNQWVNEDAKTSFRSITLRVGVYF